MKKLLLLILVIPVLVGAQVVNISDTEKIESVKSVVSAVENIAKESKITESEIRSEIRDAIDDAIIDIRSKTDIQAYELSRVINTTENTLYIDVKDTVGSGVVTDVDSIDALQTRIDNGFDDMKSALETVSGVTVDFSTSRSNVQDVVSKFRKQIADNQSLLEDMGGDLLDKDTDGDGLSDYDEVYLYDTDPENTHTVSGVLNDGEKVSRGINPTSLNEDLINFADPRTDREAQISDIYTVSRVELVDVNGEKRLRLEGKALPNSYTTLHVFSMPIVVTIKSDMKGEWVYTLDRELDNGEHSMYVSTVDNSGRIIARSSAIPFTKTAEAAAIGAFGIGEKAISQNSFVQDNFILIILAILLAAIVITLMITGRKKEVIDFIDDTKKQV